MPTSRQLDELEQALNAFHNENHLGLPLGRCTDQKCIDARLSLAWLRKTVKEHEAKYAEAQRISA